jgi:divalent metal cation (Fe/Co/Zn/Cd) transporter
MTGVAILTSSLLPLGDESTQNTKLIVIGVTVALVMLVSALVWYIISGGKRRKPAVEASE